MTLRSSNQGGQPVGNLSDREAEINHLKQLVEIYRRNLQQLELQKAMYGLSVPLVLLNSMDQTRRDLEKAEAKLARLEGEEIRPRAMPEVSVPADVAGRDIAVGGEVGRDIIRGDIYQTIIQPDLSEITSMLEQLMDKTSKLAERESKFLFNPIFSGQGFLVEDDLCFVLMPFGPEDLQIVYQDFVKPTVERAGLRCARGDDIFGSNAIIEDVWAGINRARFVVAELTGKNPNVFYEVGICHTVGKDVIFLAQSMEDVPFDLRHLRVLLYDYTPRGCLQLAEALYKTILAVIGRGVEPTV